ncbi:MAG TPA: DUF882 domain-containing protein [Elusimicrobiales bacterium]|nr:DUF882 domain-containing protein [Elusimicrobiales bacterium]HOL62546.1 DUF882 domain-containing protein [Elusimicrobiales bacterium]HPO95369.1 DUF882 domain-containing protein [Elusimicrobiales bacterium]
MVFLAVFIFNSFLFSQNLFFVSVSSSSRYNLLRDTVSDKNLNFIDNYENEKKFCFENLLIKESVNEQEIKDVEESDEEFVDIPYSIEEPEPVNLGGDGKITLKRKDTGEKVTAFYRNKDGSYNEEELNKINHIMRCSLDDLEVKIPKKLIELLDAVEDKYSRKNGLVLLSGYRTKPLNDITPGAAKNSLHMLGWAADIKIEGVSSRKIRDFARRLKVGGVGYYPRYGFVHLDIGKVRYWEKYQYSKKKRNYAQKKSVNKTSSSLSKNSKISKPSVANKKIAYNQKSVKPKK